MPAASACRARTDAASRRAMWVTAATAASGSAAREAGPVRCLAPDLQQGLELGELCFRLGEVAETQPREVGE